jgi:parallel beta helix pectate lyase-like protein
MSRRQRRREEKRRRHEGDHEGHLGRSLATGAGVTVGATLLMGGMAQAATLTVGSTDDTSGATDCAVATNTDCTLRDAIEDANAAPGSTITFASAISGDAITLNGTELPQITAYSTTIQGPGADQISIDGDFTSRIFNVSATDATISGLEIRNGTENYGGGIYLQAGNLTIQNSVVTGNEADTDDGGGIFVHTGSLTVDSSTFSYNEASRFGGAIAGRAGVAIHTGPTTIRNSTLSGNHASEIGGAAYLSYNSPATVENSTIYENYADGALGVAGGLYHAGQAGGPGLVVSGSTITNNYATVRGGGVGSGGAPPTFIRPTIRNSIVAANTVGTGGSGPDLSGNTYSMDVGFSLIGTIDSEVVINQTGPNIVGQDPQLGLLADNGGQTETQKPATTSPVVDAGSAFSLTSDQRGFVRPFDAVTANAAGGDASDIGAVELQVTDLPAAPSPPGPTGPSSPAPTTPTTKKKCKKAKKKHKRSADSAKKKCKKKKKKR